MVFLFKSSSIILDIDSKKGETQMEYEALLTALITGVFAFIAGASTRKDKYITQQREDWREHLRQWIKETSLLMYKTSEDKAGEELQSKELNKQINTIICRLNPRRDKVLIEKIRLLKIYQISQFKIIVDDLNICLKYDWERNKKSNSFLGNTQYLNITYIIILAFICYNISLEIETYKDIILFNNTFCILFITIPFMFIRLVFSETMKNEIIRGLNVYNYLNRGDKNYYLPMIELLFTGIYIMLITYLLKSSYSITLEISTSKLQNILHLLLIPIIGLFIIEGISRIVVFYNTRQTKANNSDKN